MPRKTLSFTFRRERRNEVLDEQRLRETTPGERLGLTDCCENDWKRELTLGTRFSGIVGLCVLQ